MSKFLIAVAALALAQPAFAQGDRAISLTNAETAAGFASFRECEAVLTGSAQAASAGSASGSVGDAIASGSIVNRAGGHVSRCEQVEGEYLIVVYPARARSGRGA